MFEGTRLRALREDREPPMSRETLAGLLSVSYDTVANWELGRSKPGDEALAMLADIFGVTTDYLLGRTNTAPPSLPAFARELEAAGLEVYAHGPEIRLPVYEEAAAGAACMVAETPAGYETVQASWVENDIRNYVLVRVRGDSMRDAGILPGALVLVHRLPAYDDNVINNRVVLVRLTENDHVTIKRIKLLNGSVLLIPANPAYQIEELRRDQVAVCGLVVRAVIKFD